MVNVGRTSTFHFIESELLVIYCSVFFFSFTLMLKQQSKRSSLYINGRQ